MCIAKWRRRCALNKLPTFVKYKFNVTKPKIQDEAILSKYKYRRINDEK